MTVEIATSASRERPDSFFNVFSAGISAPSFAADGRRRSCRRSRCSGCPHVEGVESSLRDLLLHACPPPQPECHEDMPSMTPRHRLRCCRASSLDMVHLLRNCIRASTRPQVRLLAVFDRPSRLLSAACACAAGLVHSLSVIDQDAAFTSGCARVGATRLCPSCST